MKKVLTLLFVVSFVVGVGSVFANGQKESSSSGSQSASSSSSSSGKQIVIKFATVASPQQLQVKALDIFKKELEKSTNGQVQVQIYPSGQLFGQTEQELAVERGDAQMTFVGGAVQKQLPTFGMFNSAYLFKNYNVMHKVLNGPIIQQFYQKVSKTVNILPLGAWYLGARELNYRNIGHEIKTPADLKGVKLRMPNVPAFLNLARALGAKPTPLSFTEVYTALQTGTIDAQDNPLPTDKAQKFYEVAKNISLTNHVLDPIFPGINTTFWNKLSPDIQKKLQKAIDDAGNYMDTQTLDQEKSLVSYFQQHGVKIVHPDINAFYDYAKKWYASHPSATKGWDKALYAAIQKANANASSSG